MLVGRQAGTAGPCQPRQGDDLVGRNAARAPATTSSPSRDGERPWRRRCSSHAAVGQQAFDRRPASGPNTHSGAGSAVTTVNRAPAPRLRSSTAAIAASS